MENISPIKALIAKGKIKKALAAAKELKIADAEAQDALILIEGSWAGLQEEIRRNLLLSNEKNVRTAQVVHRLLEWLNHLSEEQSADENKPAENKEAPAEQKATKIYNINHIDNAKFS